MAKKILPPVMIVENTPRAVVRQVVRRKELFLRSSGSDSEERVLVTADVLESKIKERVASQAITALASRISLKQKKGLTRKSGAVGISVGQKFEIVRKALSKWSDDESM